MFYAFPVTVSGYLPCLHERLPQVFLLSVTKRKRCCNELYRRWSTKVRTPSQFEKQRYYNLPGVFRKPLLPQGLTEHLSKMSTWHLQSFDFSLNIKTLLQELENSHICTSHEIISLVTKSSVIWLIASFLDQHSTFRKLNPSPEFSWTRIKIYRA